MKPGTPTAKPKGSSRREKRAAQQTKRRAREHVLEAETYEEAAQRLRVAFDVADAEASPASTATPPAESPTAAAGSPGAALAGDVVPPAEASAQASPPLVKPPEQASGPKGEASGEAKARVDPPPEPEITIDAAELAPDAVDAIDDLAVKHLGPELRLTPEKRERLVRAMKPALAELFKTKGGALRGLTPMEALLGTAAFIYGPAILDKYVFNDGEQKPAESGPRLVPAERMA